nr:MAG TPA: hypothetical protein [Caudoviricetes sp.]
MSGWTLEGFDSVASSGRISGSANSQKFLKL